MIQQDCLNNSDRRHRFTYSVGSGTKQEFEPVEYGNSAEETLYRRVLYSQLACQCGQTRMVKVIYEEDA